MCWEKQGLFHGCALLSNCGRIGCDCICSVAKVVLPVQPPRYVNYRVSDRHDTGATRDIAVVVLAVAVLISILVFRKKKKS